MTRGAVMPMIVLYAGAVSAVSMVLAGLAVRWLPYCHSVWVFLGVFGVMAVAGVWLGGRGVVVLGDRRDRGGRR